MKTEERKTIRLKRRCLRAGGDSARCDSARDATRWTPFVSRLGLLRLGFNVSRWIASRGSSTHPCWTGVSSSSSLSIVPIAYVKSAVTCEANVSSYYSFFTTLVNNSIMSILFVYYIFRTYLVHLFHIMGTPASSAVGAAANHPEYP